MVIANFTNEQDARVTGLDQYDYGQVLRIQGLKLPTAVEIHFGLEETGGTTTTRIGVTKDGVTDVVIPDSMLENGDTSLDYTIYAFIYLTDDTSGKTVHRIKMQVNARSKPEQFDRPSDTELFHEAIKAVNQSSKEAEGWAHGREDMPERATDNAKYYAGESAKSAEEIKGVEQSVKDMVATIGGIEQQVQDVKEFAGQAKTAAENALLSEQEAKKSEGAALQHRTGAETAENNAEVAEQNAKKSEQAVEQAKVLVEQVKQEVASDKVHIDGQVTAFDRKVTEANSTIDAKKTESLSAIGTAKTDATNAISTAKTDALGTVGTAKTDAVNAVTAEGTAQAKKVTDEGTKQVGAVNTEAQKHQKAMQEAVNGIVTDRQQIAQNKTDVTRLKEDLTELTPRVDELEKKTAKYSEQFFENFFAMQRTGKIYTVRFPLWETSQVATGEKLDDNEGLVMEASTLTEKGRDDYSSIPLFKTYDCNVEQVNGKPKISAMCGDKEFDSKEKDTFVLGMSYYHKFWIQDGYMYYSRSDSPHEGYVICNEAKKKNGERPFCLYAKYVSGTNSKGELGSFYGKNPTRSRISFNTSLSEAKKRGKGHIFGCSADYAYIQNTFMLKYANRNWNTVLGGNFGYDYQYKISTPEANTKRVILSKANAETFIIGSCVSVGDLGQDTNKDRGSAKIHNICDSVKILDIVDVDGTNKALVLDVKNNITTTETTWVTSMHWRSGFSSEVKGIDGCPCDTKSQISSMKYPTVFQGIELAVGGYEVLGNAFMDILTDPLVRDTYICDDSEKLTNNVTTAKANWKKLAKQLSVEKNNAWCYGTEIHMDLESGINVITKAGASGSGSNAGFCDGIYFDACTNTQREFLLLGALWDWGIGGAFFSHGHYGLGFARWHFLARLSLSIYRGEFA